MCKKNNIAWIACITAALCVAPATLQSQAPPFVPNADQAPLVDASHAQYALLLVERWLTKGEVLLLEDVPEARGLQEKPMPVAGLLGVCVTLRMEGITVGTGEAFRDDRDQSHQPTNLVQLTRRATAKAFDELRDNLLTAELRAAMRGRGGAEHKENISIRDVAASVQADVQLAHHPEAIQIPPNAPDNRLYASFAPGYHGLYAEATDNSHFVTVWPASALAANIAPNSQLIQLATALNLNPRQALTMGRPDNPALHRFNVYHVTYSQPESKPTLLVRGNLVLPPQTVSEKTLREMSETLAKHLDRRITSDGVMRGTYHPTSGRYDPPLAEPAEALLAAYAMTLHVEQQRKRRPKDETLSKLNSRVQTLAERIAESMTDGRLEPSAAMISLALLTIIDNPLPPRRVELRDTLIDMLLSLRDETGQFRSAPNDDAEPANHTASALATAALAGAYDQTRRETLGHAVRESFEVLWNQTKRKPNINALPWLLLARERGDSIWADDNAAQTIMQTREQTVGQWVDLLITKQIVDPPALGPTDVIGGFELSARSNNAPPNPTWTTAQLTSFIAIATRQPGVRKNHDPLGWLLASGLAARFCQQLMVSDENCYYMRSSSDAIGGVRLTLWDNRLTVNATAMALFATTQLERTLDGF